jgi:Domain of unknown function (DUF4430)
MKRSSLLALGAAALALVAAPAAALAAKVSVRIEGAAKTLQAAKTIQTGSGSITKFGAPAGACPAASVLGALDTSTHGKWKGTFSTSFNDFFITSILGETPSSKTGYWGVWLNNKYATTGACEIKLRAGDQVLFAVDSVKKHEHPLGIIAPAKARAGKVFDLKIVSYSDSGQATPVAGAAVHGGGGPAALSDKHGILRVASTPATLTFTATDKGFIRSAAATVKVTK